MEKEGSFEVVNVEATVVALGLEEASWHDDQFVLVARYDLEAIQLGVELLRQTMSTLAGLCATDVDEGFSFPEAMARIAIAANATHELSKVLKTNVRGAVEREQARLRDRDRERERERKVRDAAVKPSIDEDVPF